MLRVQLPDSVDSLILYKRALEGEIAITPGYLFSPTEQYPNFIRLNAANWSGAAESVMERLGTLVAQLAAGSLGRQRYIQYEFPQKWETFKVE